MLVTKPDWDAKRWDLWDSEEKKKAASIRGLEKSLPCMDISESKVLLRPSGQYT